MFEFIGKVKTCTIVEKNYAELMELISKKLLRINPDPGKMEDSTELIPLDIHRASFLESNQKTFEDFMRVWIEMPQTRQYKQGNMTGGVFSELIFLIATEANLDELASRGRVELGYFNETGIPCGFSITYSKTKPELWTISIIENTTEEAENRNVILFIPFQPPILSRNHNDKYIRVDKILDNLNSITKAPEISELLGNFLLPNGKCNVEKLNRVSENLNERLAHCSFKV